MPQMPTSDITAVKDLIVALAAVVGAAIAWRGLQTWKRQLKGGVEYDLARRLMRCTYLYRDALIALRHPAMFGWEMPSPPDDVRAEMSHDEIRHFGTARAYQSRWEKVTAARTALDTELIEAEVLWGDGVKGVYESMFALQHELFGVVLMYLRATDPKENAHTKESLLDALAKKRDIMYDLSGVQPDEFSKDLSSAVGKVEEFVKPHLQK